MKKRNKKNWRVRGEKGQFVKTTGSEPYKNVQYKSKRMGEHRRAWIKEYGEIPKGMMIHHKNGKKKDNRIENLELMDFNKHNNLHKHPAWNKGIKCPGISKSKMGHEVTERQKVKQRTSWFNKYLDCNIKIWKLKDQDMNTKQISNKLNLTVGQVNARWRGFTKVCNIDGGRFR